MWDSGILGKTLIDSMLLGSILVNSEVAYNISKEDINKFEKCHEKGLRMLLSLPVKSPKTMLYLLTGSIPIRYQLKRRRFVYLHHILNLNDDSLLHTFFEAQLNTMKSKDWAKQVIMDLSDYDIDLSMDEIQCISELNWKQMMKEKTINKALDYLNSVKGRKHRNYGELKMAPYLCPNNEDLSVDVAKFIAKAQSCMIENIKSNFRKQYEPNMICNACNIYECTQAHLLECNVLINGNDLVTYIPIYEEIFDDKNTTEQIYVAMIMMENLRKKEILEENIVNS